MKEEVNYKRHSYYEDRNIPQDFLHFKLIVKTEEEKQEYLKASEYIHDFVVCGYEKRFGKSKLWGLDSDIMGVNWFMHLYESPDAIEVKPDEKFWGFNEEIKN